MINCSVNKHGESLSLQKGGSYWRGCRLTQLPWREVYRHRDPGRHRARHFLCRWGYRTEVFYDFRCHVSVSFIASYTLPRTRRHWRRRHFVRLSSFDEWHILYCIAREKGCCLQWRKSKRSRPYLQRFSFRAISESSLVRKRAWTMHLDVFISLCRSVCLHTSFENRIAWFSTSSFFYAILQERWSEHYIESLFEFVVVFVERTVSRQSHSDSTRSGWRHPRWSGIHFVKLCMSTSGKWSIRYVSDLVKYSAYPIDMHYTKVVPVRFALLWRSSSFSSTTCVETTLHKKNIFFAIISLKVVSQRSVFVTCDLIVVIKTL